MSTVMPPPQTPTVALSPVSARSGARQTIGTITRRVLTKSVAPFTRGVRQTGVRS